MNIRVVEAVRFKPEERRQRKTQEGFIPLNPGGFCLEVYRLKTTVATGRKWTKRLGTTERSVVAVSAAGLCLVSYYFLCIQY